MRTPYGIPDEIISAIMIAYKNTKSIVRTAVRHRHYDGDTDFINISGGGGVLQGNTLKYKQLLLFIS